MPTGNAEKLTRWAQSLALPSDRVTFFNFLASHDGIGLNPARGILSDAEIDALVRRTLAHGGFISYKDMPDGSQAPYEMNINYLDALSNPAASEPAELAARKFLTAHAIMLSLQGVPGIYFHSLFGSRGDRAGAEASGIPRRINREKLDGVSAWRLSWLTPLRCGPGSWLASATFCGYAGSIRRSPRPRRSACSNSTRVSSPSCAKPRTAPTPCCACTTSAPNRSRCA